jgi:hypothetical protein
MLPDSVLPATSSPVPGPVITTPEPGPATVLPPMKTWFALDPDDSASTLMPVKSAPMIVLPIAASLRATASSAAFVPRAGERRHLGG